MAASYTLGLSATIVDELHKNREKHFVIPDIYDSIGGGAFKYDHDLESVEIPDSITWIGSYAFHANQLKDIDIPDKVAGIEKHAFSSNNLTSVVIPGSTKTIGQRAFAANLLESAIFSDGVIRIGDNAFENNQIKSIKIPDSVREIGSLAFQNNQIKSIEFADEGAYALSSVAFHDNPLETIIVSEFSLRRSTNLSQANYPGVKFIIKEDPGRPNLESSEFAFTSNDAAVLIDAIYERYDRNPGESFSGNWYRKEESFQVEGFPKIKNRTIKNIITGMNSRGSYGKVLGTSNVDVITGGPQVSDGLTGGAGADFFHLFSPDFIYNRFAKRTDRINDFDRLEGDSLLIGKDEFGLGDKVTLKTLKSLKNRKRSKKKRDKAFSSSNQFIYDLSEGYLYFNENGREEGWGDAGGKLAQIVGAPKLSITDFTFL